MSLGSITPVHEERSGSDGWGPGERAECELCTEQKLCVDRYGLVTCQSCRRIFLPPASLLSF